MRQLLKIITIVLALLLVRLLWLDHVERQKMQEYYRQLEMEALPFRVEQSDLEQQLVKLNRDHEIELAGTASLELLFTEPSNEFMKEIAPLMAEEELPGVLVLSLEQLSGKSEMVKMKDIHELLENGWSWCLYYNGEQEQKFSDWLNEAVTCAAEKGLPETSAVYFKSGTYSSDFDILLHKAGISILIYHGEENHPLIAEAAGETASVWKAEAYGWNGDGSSELMRRAILQGKNLVFTIGMDTIGEVFESSQFQSMISTLKNYELREKFVVTDLKQANILQKEQAGMNTDKQVKLDFEEKIKKLEQQIEELEQQIHDIYKKENSNEIKSWISAS